MAASLLLALPVGAYAVTYNETGDAGDLPATAQVVFASSASALGAIKGTLAVSSSTHLSEADMYRIYISSPTTFSATTTGFVAGTNNFDSQLFLFRTNGLGIAADDDDPSTGSPQSTLPAGNSRITSLAAGAYDLLITGSGQFPASSSGQIFPNFADSAGDDPTLVYGPTGPGGAKAITGYSGNSNEGGNYSIALTGAQFIVPLAGDANLDGKVDVTDLGILATHYNQNGGFTSGDFDYSGKIDVSDLGLLATNYGSSTMSYNAALALVEAQTGVSLPEPSSLLVLSIGLALKARTRRAV